jgi:hypothetical protein
MARYENYVQAKETQQYGRAGKEDTEQIQEMMSDTTKERQEQGWSLEWTD